MSLVNYSDSNDSDESENAGKCDEKLEKSVSKKPRLELPEIFKSAKESLHEKPELHQGRSRAIPHERGNWISYFYINYPLNDSLKSIQDEIIKHAKVKLNLELNGLEEIHLSLSRVLNIRYHWIQDIFKTVKEENLNPFVLKIDPVLKVLVNDEKTRTFIGLTTAEESNSDLEEVVGKIDNCLESYKLPIYYKPPIFHISFLWGLGDCKEKITDEILEEFNEILLQNFAQDDDEENFTMVVENLIFKSGNKIFNLNLRG